MIFNSVTFLVFIAIFFIFWPIASKKSNPRFLYLVIASFIFYGAWDWRFLFLIIFSGLVDFFSAIAMYHLPKQKKLFLILSLVANIGSLAIFKYSAFFAESIEQIAAHFNIELVLAANLPEFVLILPVGISFYTFQSMSYTVDVYREKLDPTYNVLHFFAYLSMFPQLVAGPIVRAHDLLPALRKPPKHDESLQWQGTKLIVSGYFMKMVIADNLAIYVDQAFQANPLLDGFYYWWIIILSFAFQIYFDFAGYSRIARGLALWIGYSFPINFDRPYTASSLQEFWRRWHISLSTWFRDYVYIPLGGSKKGFVRGLANMWVVMLVSGLWHGAAYTFVIWGALHAFFYTIERLTKWPDTIKEFKGGEILATGIVLSQVLIAWVFFRAESLDQALEIITKMFSFTKNPEVFQVGTFSYLWIGLGLFYEFIYPKIRHWVWIPETLNIRVFSRETVLVALLIAVTIFFRGTSQTFVYFQF